MAKKGKNVKRAFCLAVVVVFAGVVSGFCAEDTKPSKEGPKAEAVPEKEASPKDATKRPPPDRSDVRTEPARPVGKGSDKAAGRDEEGKPDPFAPSDLMRERARPKVDETKDQRAVPPSARAKPGREVPVLEAVMVKGQSVLASFRTSTGSVLLAPRGSLVVRGDEYTATNRSGKLQTVECKYTFIGYSDGCAVMRGDDGKIYELRVGAGPTKPGSQRRGTRSRTTPPRH
jgi:hypothetical protein